MNRAERRKNGLKNREPVYNMTAAQLDSYNTEAEAIEAWNTRADTSNDKD